MKIIKKFFGMAVFILFFGMMVFGCATKWDGAVYSPPSPPIFNEENIARGEFFKLNSVYRSSSNNIDGYCFIVNLGSFTIHENVTSYEMIFSEYSTSANATNGINLQPSFVQERDVSIMPPGRHAIALLSNDQVIGTNTTNEEFIAGRYYYLYNDGNNRPMIYSLSNDGTLSWGGLEVSKNAIIEGLNNFLALEFGWHMEVTPLAPSPETLERRSYDIRDREAAAIGRYITRSINSGEYVRNTNADEWFILRNSLLPDEIFYVCIYKGYFRPIEVYRKIN